MSDPKLPESWDQDRIQAVIAHYENQAEDKQFDEIEAALEAENITMMAVPTDRVAEFQALLAGGSGGLSR